MSVNAFPLNSTILNALEVSLSPERLATYLTAAGKDREKALHLYTWNTAVSAAFYGPLQGLEVAVTALCCSSATLVAGRATAAWAGTP